MIKHPIENIPGFIAITAFGLTNGYSQTDATKFNAYEGLSLKNLLNIKIVSDDTPFLLLTGVNYEF